MSLWLLSNSKKVNCIDKLKIIVENKKFKFFSDGEYITYHLDSKKIHIQIDGYVLPRLSCYHELSKFKQTDLVFEVFKNHQEKFLKYIKGNFLIVIVYENEFIVANDHVGVKQFFYNIPKSQFFISSNLQFIVQNSSSQADEISIIPHSLMQHFIAGRTFLKYIRYSQPARLLQYKDSLTVICYWSADELVELSRENISYREFADYFKEIIIVYIDFLAPQKISMTLTGGRDTRTILAALLNIDANPRTFTFGAPTSGDVITANKIAVQLGLEFNNHFQRNPTAEWYLNLSKEIVKIGNSLIHLHRAHRLDAIRREKELAPEIDMVFMGSMGGDYIKGAFLDDYIITELVRRWWFDSKISKVDLISELLERNFINISEDQKEEVFTILSNEKYFGNNLKHNEFYIVHNLVGGLHDSQDINLFAHEVQYCVAPFMDIDFLYKLFNSKYSLFSNYKTSKNPLKRIKGAELHCNIINILAPRLAEIDFVRPYSPKDVVGNYYYYIIKRSVKEVFTKKPPSNFAYGDWFTYFVDFQLKNYNNKKINNIFNMFKYDNNLYKNRNFQVEAHWHKFTNIIMIKLLSNYFLNY